jgi:3-oxoacyl-[acyl-carrier-protein] synthase I
MSDQSIVLEQCEIISPLGSLGETVADLIDGASAIVPGPFFSVPVSCAPFQDERCRCLEFAAPLLQQAVDLKEIDPQNTVFIFCCAKGDISAIENSGPEKNQPLFLPLPGSQAGYLQNLLVPGCPRTIAISNACASGAIAVETAKELLETGAFTHAVVFGFDAISRFVTTGFASLNALSPTGARPFDATRDGLTLGEGACVAVLTKRTPYAGDVCVEGAGGSNDANHRTGPSRTGEGLLRAARAALADARVAPAEIGAVKCHGTATAYNDAMEAKALDALFDKNIPACCSVKGAIGHTSGAGSLLEIILAAEFLKRHALPPTAGFSTLWVEEAVPVSSEPQVFDGSTLLCLSAGFGGVNAAVVLREVAP